MLKIEPMVELFLGRCQMFQNAAIVLVRPAGDLNIGSAARAMKNTGFSDLVIVNGTDHLTQNAFKMAPSSREILEQARVEDSLDQALKDRHLTFGITARHRRKRPRLTPMDAAPGIEFALKQGHRIALVFGPEDKGLSAEEADQCTDLIGIPAHSDLMSYNLAQAVLLVCHALFLGIGALLPEGAEPFLGTQEDKDRIKAQFLDLLKIAEHLTPNRKDQLEDMTTRLIYRAQLETRDVRNILAVIRHLKFKLENP